VVRKNPVVAYPDEPLRVVVYRMAESGLTRMPVIADEESRRLVGLISLDDLLCARVRDLEEEGRRERVLRIHLPFQRARRLEPASQGSGVKGSRENGGTSADSSGESGD